MSAEDVGRVGGTERRGGEGVSERRYRTLTCFGLISGRTLCAEATGFNLGAVGRGWGRRSCNIWN